MDFNKDIIIEKIMERVRDIDTKTLEIEMRIGIIKDIQTNNRLYLPVIHNVIFIENKIFQFIPGVSPSDFDIFTKRAEKQMEKQEEFEDKQVITKVGRVRYIKEKPVECIKKVRICTWNIYNYKCNYDVRISLSREVEQTMSMEQKKDLLKNSSGFTRLRSRASYKTGNIQCDLTKVKMGRKETNEVETEMLIDEKLERADLENFLNDSLKFFNYLTVQVN